MATTSRDEGLDGLRGIAALLVFFSHVGMMTWWPGPDARSPSTVEFSLWHLGAPSVDLFFVLSGYVLAASLERVRLDAASTGAFVARRWVRLMPVALSGVLVGLAVKACIVPLQHDPLVGMISMDKPLRWQDVTGIFTFLVPMPDTERFNVPLWSLVIEMYASFLIPLTIAGLRSQGRLFLLYAALIPVVLWLVSDRLEFMTLPLFVMGVATRTYFPPIRREAAAAALAMGLVILFSRHVFGEFGFWHRYVSGIGAMLTIMSVHAGAAHGFLTRRTVSWLGRISYPFYAVHYPLVLASTILLSSRGLQANLAALAALPAALAAAHLVQTTVEKASIRASRRIGAAVLRPTPTG